MPRARSILLARCRDQKFGSGMVATGCKSASTFSFCRAHQLQVLAYAWLRDRRRGLRHALSFAFILVLAALALASLNVVAAQAETAAPSSAQSMPAPLSVGDQATAEKTLPPISNAVHLHD